MGLSLALSLAQRGVPVRVFEADAELNNEIRASTFHPPTLELFDRWGVLEEMLAHGHQVRSLQYWDRPNRALIAQFDYAQIAGDTPFPFRLQCPQHIATRVLKPAVETLPNASVHMAHRLIDFTDHGSHISAQVETPEGVQVVAGAFLCGADGARSTVRDKLGLRFDGLTYEDRFLLIGTDIDLQPLFPGIGPVSYIFDPTEWVIVLHLPDLVRVVFRMRPEEDETDATSQAALRARLWRFLGQELPFEVKTLQIYRVHQRVAETFRVGRVLLLGDSAHINNPAGGMGMNSGIHDAALLAGQLSAVLAGQPEQLLDEYSTVRRRAALDSVQAYTAQTYSDMTLRDPAARQARNQALQAQAADPAQARAYLLRASMIPERI